MSIPFGTDTEKRSMGEEVGRGRRERRGGGGGGGGGGVPLLNRIVIVI